MDIAYLVKMAVDGARGRLVDASAPGKLHARRSRDMVEGLARLLREVYGHKDNVAVFSKYHEENRRDFGLNELLFDIAVCEWEETRSASDRKTLKFVTRGLWAIESELARDTRQAVYDFNKLVLSSADLKLFLGPHSAMDGEYLRVLEGPAARCTGAIYVALVPHPDSWDGSPPPVEAWVWSREKWVPLPLTDAGPR